MASSHIKCWSCAQPFDATGGIFRSTTCPRCEEDLHVCLQCVHYDPAVNQSCREPMAEWVKAKERANFCVYFRAASEPGERARGEDLGDARKKLNDLFDF